MVHQASVNLKRNARVEIDCGWQERKAEVGQKYLQQVLQLITFIN